MSNPDQKEKDLILEWMHNFSVELSLTQLDLLFIYLNELWEWNKKFNLTGLSSRANIITELLLDSLLPLPYLPKTGNLLDVGSGAGFPSIPIKICHPNLKADLLEPNSKKVSFLKQIIRITGLRDIRVIRGRIDEDSSLLLAEEYNIVSTRALADLPHTLMWCAPFISPGGIFISFQGNTFQNSLKKSSPILDKNKIYLYKVIPYQVPEKNSQRHLLVFVKNV